MQLKTRISVRVVTKIVIDIRRLLKSKALFCLVYFIGLCANAAQNTKYEINIAEQPLAKSLNQLSDQTETLVLFSYELVDNKQGQTVRGQYSINEAIDILLEGTDLVGSMSKMNVLMVAEKKPSSIAQTQQGEKPINAKKPTFASFIASLFSAQPEAQTRSKTSKQDLAESIEKISVLGTRGKPRTLADSTAPVDVFSGSEFSAIGNTVDITDNLKVLVPSFTATPATGDGSAFIRPTSLRGLAPDQTLVLVNGKRRHRSALVQFLAPAAGNGAHGVDIGMIPKIALKGVEVLRDGAAAQYGSDAIAGVINFQMKDDRDSGSVVAQYGQFYEGEHSWYVGANRGFTLGEDGFANVSIESNDNEALSRGFLSPEAQLLIDAGVEGVGTDSPFGDGPLVQSWGRPETRATRTFVHSGYDLNADQQLYFTIGYADTDGRYRFFYRGPGHATLADVDTLPAGYTPFLDGAQQDLSLVAGLKGSTPHDLEYDLSASFGKNKLSYFLNNSVNPGLVANGSPGQRDFDMGGFEQREINLNADVSKPVGDSAYFSFGAEWREETFTTIAGEEAALIGAGPSGMSAVGPADAGDFGRENFAIYGEYDYEASANLLVQAAIRYENFSDFGGTLNGKLAARYRITDNLNIRGGISTGFHAPTPGQSNISTIITTFDGATGEQVEEGLLPTSNPVAIANGATDLKEEESVNMSLGFTYDGFEDSNFTIDFYHIAVDDRIYRTGDIPVDTGGTISFFTNALDVEHRGIDFVYTKGFDWSKSTSTKFSLAYAYNTIDVVAQEAVNGVLPVSDAIIEDIENNYPEHRVVATALTDLAEHYQFMLRLNYYGEHFDERGTIDAEVEPSAQIDPVVYVDMELTYFATEELTLTLGAANVFDTFVDEIGEENANRLNVGLQYPRRTVANYEGGSWYMRLNYAF